MKKKFIKELKNDVRKHNIYQYDEIANKLGITEKPNLFKTYIINAIPIFCSLVLVTSGYIMLYNSIQNDNSPITPNETDFFHSEIFKSILGVIILIGIGVFIYFIAKLIRLIIKNKR